MKAKLVRDDLRGGYGAGEKTERIKHVGMRHILLVAKLHEEIEELHDDPTNAEEYADTMEALFALAKLHGVSPQKIVSIRTKKRTAKGGFDTGNLLITE